VCVKTVIFKAYCVCLYGVPLWLHYNAGTMATFKCCFHKCLRRFFGFNKYRYYSVTSVLLELGLPSFDTVIHNYRFCFRSQWRQHSNPLTGVVQGVCHDAFSVFLLVFFTFYVLLRSYLTYVVCTMDHWSDRNE